MKEIIIITLTAALVYVVSNPFIQLYRGIKDNMKRRVGDE